MARQIPRLISTGRRLSTAAALLALTGCTTPRQRAPMPVNPPAAATSDAAYDWHRLLTLPFGTLLKDAAGLHEVLLFTDRSQSAAAAATRDCYTVDGSPPKFLGRPPEDYLLCFGHDRLNRVEATARLAPGEAEETFAHACAGWLKNATPAAGSPERCEGSDHGIDFSARLEAGSGETPALLTMTLSPAAESEAGAAAPSP